MTADFALQPIGYVSSPYRGKFAVPRQSGLATSVSGFVQVDPAWRDALTGLEGVSHVWLIFVFHAVPSGRAATRARPPRLGGNARVGVFATRSTHRPNPIGLSLVKVDAVQADGIQVSGVDVVDGTPVLDIKPYLVWSESVPGARNDIAPVEPDRLDVQWSDAALLALSDLSDEARTDVAHQLEDVLSFDARPGFHEDPERSYSAEFGAYRVQWRYPSDASVEVLSVTPFDG